jgi:hypothetical protein
MSTVAAELERCQRLMAAGKGDEHCTPVILPGQEAAKRVQNKEGKTRAIFETDSHHIYSQLNAQKDRAIRVIENKTVAWAVLAHLWARVSDDELRELAKGNWG